MHTRSRLPRHRRGAIVSKRRRRRRHIRLTLVRRVRELIHFVLKKESFSRQILPTRTTQAPTGPEA